ncbi:hypothetical protein, partial [Achromobacter ruhlandii]|uniref:hypothetical protein n=1 Tax=Achromobacter ruhlandii TaxID=72557 RepID=UPI001C2E3F3E
PPDKYRLTALSLNCSSYFVMKNTPKIGLMSNFWGAVHGRPFFAYVASCVVMLVAARLRRGVGGVT